MDVIKDALDALLVEAEAQLLACSIPVEQVGILPGNTVAWDNPCEGQLWARVISITPYPQPGSGRGPNTNIDFLQVNAGLGIVRCWAGVDDDGVAPTATEMDADADRMLQDADALLTALVAQGFRPTGGLPLGPTGYSGGFEWTFLFQKTPCIGCE